MMKLESSNVQLHARADSKTDAIRKVGMPVGGKRADQTRLHLPSRADRICKNNQLLRIEERLGSMAQYRGMSEFYNIRK